jgi:hypothetical protein
LNEDDICPSLSKTNCDRLANASRTSGDQGGFTYERKEIHYETVDVATKDGEGLLK